MGGRKEIASRRNRRLVEDRSFGCIPQCELAPCRNPTVATAERAHRQPSHELVAKIVERAKSRPSLGENAVDIIRRMRDGERD
jgi:hypothetical protein